MVAWEPSDSSARHWSPRQRKWYTSTELTGLLVTSLAFVFALSNAIQSVDNDRGPVNGGFGYRAHDFAAHTLIPLAIITPLAQLIVSALNITLYTRRTLKPWMVLTWSLIFLGAWAVCLIFTLIYGLNLDFGNYVALRVITPLKRDAEPQAVVASTSVTRTITPTRTAVSYVYAPTHTVVQEVPIGYHAQFVSNTSIRGVPVSQTVWWIRVALTALAALVQFFYIGVAARAIDVERKSRKANVTFLEPVEAGIPQVAPATDAPSPAAAANRPHNSNLSWSSPRSTRASMASFESFDEKKGGTVAKEFR